MSIWQKIIDVPKTAPDNFRHQATLVLLKPIPFMQLRDLAQRFFKKTSAS
jgi:hypothetical protein